MTHRYRYDRNLVNIFQHTTTEGDSFCVEKEHKQKRKNICYVRSICTSLENQLNEVGREHVVKIVRDLREVF